MTTLILSLALAAVPVEHPVPVRNGLLLDDRVLKVTLPEGQSPSIALVQWTQEYGDVLQRPLILTPGLNVVEMRGVPGWSGEVRNASVFLVQEPGQVQLSLARPNWSDEWALATRTRFVSMHFINYQEAIPIGFGYRLEAAVVAGAILLWLAFRFVGKFSWGTSLLLASSLCLALREFRESLDRWRIACRGADSPIAGLGHSPEFVKQVEPLLDGQTWTMIGVGQYAKYYILYSLAEHRYVLEADQADWEVISGDSREAAIRVDDLSLIKGRRK